MSRPSTPPRKLRSSRANPISPPTPDVKRRIEENRLKAKAIRDQYEAAQRQSVPTLNRTPSGFATSADISLAGRKRAHASISTADIPKTSRDGRNSTDNYSRPRADDNILAAQKFTKFVDYDLSKMADTKGGFMTIEDDPHNKALHNPEDAAKPAHMSLKEWERLQLERKLRRAKQGKFEPGLGFGGGDGGERKRCRECGSLEIDWQWEEVFGCCVCGTCKDKSDEKYSLLTKSEVKSDYLLTDPELKDPELLPHLKKPNPREAHWHDMMLFLRYQVEEYAFGPKKWGSAAALDAEFERREADKKKRKEDKFKAKLIELKRKTRTEQYRKGMKAGINGGKFGDVVGSGRHEHEWGREVENEKGETVKNCVDCGMEVEVLEF